MAVLHLSKEPIPPYVKSSYKSIIKKNPKAGKKWAEIMNRKGNKNNAYIYKKCPVSRLTTERQIKTTLRDDLFIQWAKSKV